MIPLIKEVDPEVVYTSGVTQPYVLAEFPDGRLISREGKRIFADGRFDPSFRTDIDGALNAALSLPDHTVLVGGRFERVNGFPRHCLAWLATESPPTIATVGWNASRAATPERGEARLTLIREGDAQSEITVRYRTIPGTASASVDYEPRDGSVHFEAGQRSAEITIPVVDDAVSEADETFFVELQVDGAQVRLGENPRIEVQILDDDQPFGLSPPVVTVRETAGFAAFAISRTNSFSYPLVVNWGLSGGSARVGLDLATNQDALLILPFSTNLFWAVPLIDNAATDGLRTAIISPQKWTSSAKIDPARASVTLQIIDNDLGGVPGDAFDGGIDRAAFDEAFGLGCVGSFTRVNGSPANTCVRLDSLGRRVESFVLDPQFSPSSAAIAVRGSYAFLGGSWPSTTGGDPRFGISVVDGKGQEQARSQVPLSFSPRQIFASPDGSFYGLGNFDDALGAFPYNGFLNPQEPVRDKRYSAGQVVRFLPNGDKDTHFALFSDGLSSVSAVFDSTGAEFWLGGFYSVFDGPLPAFPRSGTLPSPKLVARSLGCFRSDGSLILDRTLRCQSFGKNIRQIAGSKVPWVWIAAVTNSVDGVFRHGLFRMSWDGVVDPNFNPPIMTIPGYQGYVRSVADHVDGGCVALVALGAKSNALIRVTHAGEIDSRLGIHKLSYDRASATFGLVTTSEGNIFVYGGVQTADGRPRARLARFHPGGMLASDTTLELHLAPSLVMPTELSLWIDSRLEGAGVVESSSDLHIWNPISEIQIRNGYHEAIVIPTTGADPVFWRVKLR